MTMQKKYIEDENGNKVLPITHFSAVRNSSGDTLEDVLYTESTYDPTTYSGMGRKVLQKNMVNGVNTLTQDMMPVATGGNTIYIIRYDFTLGEDITVPSGCILEFDGGSISANSNNDTITGNNTEIVATDVAIFTGVVIAGTWVCPRITSRWFSDVTSNNRIRQVFNLSNASVQNSIVVEEGNYNVSVSVEAENVIGINSNSDVTINGNIILATNAFNNYQIITIQGQENVYLKGKGHIIGDVETHTGADTQQYGHCVYVVEVNNLFIEGLTFEKAWGDGVLIEGGHESEYGSKEHASKNVVVNNITCDSNRRTGLSVTHAKDIYISNSRFINTGTIKYHSTGRGIDIEPNATNDWKCSVENVYVDNCEFYGNVGGCIGIVSPNDNPEYCRNIFINNCIAPYTESVGIGIVKNVYIDKLRGGIIYPISGNNDCTNINITNSSVDRIELRSAGTYNLRFDNCVIGEYRTDANILIKTNYTANDNIIISNSTLYFKDGLTSSQQFPGTEIVNSRILQIDSSQVNNAFYVGKIRNCYIKSYNIYLGGNSSLMLSDCRIEVSSNKVFYVYNGDTLELINNKFVNESGVLLDIRSDHPLQNLYIEGKIPSSMDNITAQSAYVTGTKTNRAEHYSV